MEEEVVGVGSVGDGHVRSNSYTVRMVGSCSGGWSAHELRSSESSFPIHPAPDHHEQAAETRRVSSHSALADSLLLVAAWCRLSPFAQVPPIDHVAPTALASSPEPVVDGRFSVVGEVIRVLVGRGDEVSRRIQLLAATPNRLVLAHHSQAPLTPSPGQRQHDPSRTHLHQQVTYSY